MRSFRDVFCGFFCVLTAQTLLCRAVSSADLHPPTELSYHWIDDLMVRVQWKKPHGLPADSKLWYKMDGKAPYITIWKNSTEFIPIENKPQTFTIASITKRESPFNLNASITIHPKKPSAEVVRDFVCLLGNESSCSWTPVDPSLTLSLTFWDCTIENKRREYECNYNSEEKNSCMIKPDDKSHISPDNKVCVAAQTEAGMQKFRAKRQLYPPDLKISEEGDFLRLTFGGPPSSLGQPACWSYELCHRKCNLQQECRNTTEGTTTVIYEKGCVYEFKAKTRAVEQCPKIESVFSKVKTYGKKDWTLTVIAIVMPIVLSACVLLSCYCFRRYKAIICPIIPDPSSMFKEMMMSGNKDMRVASRLYTPVPEVIEHYKITAVSENSALQQNS